MEASACGLPVVNTNVDSGVPYVCRDGESGLTVESGNPDALAEAINRLLSDEPLRQKLAQQALQRAEKDFSIELMGQRILQVYREMLGK